MYASWLAQLVVFKECRRAGSGPSLRLPAEVLRIISGEERNFLFFIFKKVDFDFCLCIYRCECMPCVYSARGGQKREHWILVLGFLVVNCLAGILGSTLESSGRAGCALTSALEEFPIPFRSIISCQARDTGSVLSRNFETLGLIPS